MIQAVTSEIWIFGIIFVLLAVYAAYMTGQGAANTWQPFWLMIVYILLLGFGERFLAFALFDDVLLSATGYAIDTGIILAVAAFAFRLNRARRMVSQYPWLYDRAGLFGWRSKH